MTCDNQHFKGFIGLQRNISVAVRILVTTHSTRKQVRSCLSFGSGRRQIGQGASLYIESLPHESSADQINGKIAQIPNAHLNGLESTEYGGIKLFALEGLKRFLYDQGV